MAPRTAHRLIRAIACALACASGSGCGGDGGPAASNGIVQIASVVTNPATVNCHQGFASPDSIYHNVEMVNTTASPVTVTGVGSSGTIVRGLPDSSIVGRAALTFAALPFRATATTIPPGIGRVTLTVAMPAAALCRVDVTLIKDVYTSVRVTTTAGMYVTSQILIRVLTS